MEKLPNCHFQGEQAPEEIPGFLNAMDVSIVPFVKNATTDAVRPLKVLEALAMHRPVVASPLPEMEGWPYVFPASDERGFQEGIKQALEASGRMPGDLNLTKFLESNSWDESVRRLLFRMNRLLLQRAKSRLPVAP
jgi:glycosyltransferase involved in cell wall biosynthesis